MEGFTGTPRRTCRDTGWTGESQCTGSSALTALASGGCADVKLSLSLEITCNRKDFVDAEIVGPMKSVYSYKEKVEYTCLKGYGGGFTLICGDGWWTGTNNCKRKSPPCRPAYIFAFVQHWSQSLTGHPRFEKDRRAPGSLNHADPLSLMCSSRTV